MIFEVVLQQRMNILILSVKVIIVSTQNFLGVFNYYLLRILSMEESDFLFKLVQFAMQSTYNVAIFKLWVLLRLHHYLHKE
jgi:hypothetical protein